jgi:hypothetical protein
MKRYNYLFLLLIAVSSMVLVSCDDDDDWYYDDWYGRNWRDGEHNDQNQDQIDFVKMAQTLAGDWHGTTTATFQNQDGQWQTVKYYTEINFTLASASNATFGNGLQNDFEGDNTQATYSRQFTWYIDTQDNPGDIIIEYIDPNNVSSKFKMIISYDDLRLNERTFTGKIVAEDKTESDVFDWSYMSGAKNVTLTFEGEQ